MGGARPEVKVSVSPHFTMDEELLILEVQNHKVIYDPSNPFYKDNHKKDEACKKIAEVVGVDGK